jgi:SSS family solute:Na+ symporter
MSMGLRAVVLLAPMTTALFLPGKIRSMAAILSSFLGVVAMIVGNFFPLPFDSLFLGLFVAVVVLLIDYFIGAKAEAQ